jgi:hypothetical protein
LIFHSESFAKSLGLKEKVNGKFDRVAGRTAVAGENPPPSEPVPSSRIVAQIDSKLFCSAHPVLTVEQTGSKMLLL